MPSHPPHPAPPDGVPDYRTIMESFAAYVEAERPQLSSPVEVAALLRPILSGKAQEECHVLLLDTKNRLIRDEVVTVGLADRSQLHPREVYREAIRSSCTRIILVHGHPSGDPTPSAQDVAVTRQLAEAGRILGIELIDHVILGRKCRQGTMTLSASARRGRCSRRQEQRTRNARGRCLCRPAQFAASHQHASPAHRELAPSPELTWPAAPCTLDGATGSDRTAMEARSTIPGRMPIGTPHGAVSGCPECFPQAFPSLPRRRDRPAENHRTACTALPPALVFPCRGTPGAPAPPPHANLGATAQFNRHYASASHGIVL